MRGRVLGGAALGTLLVVLVLTAARPPTSQPHAGTPLQPQATRAEADAPVRRRLLQRRAEPASTSCGHQAPVDTFRLRHPGNGVEGLAPELPAGLYLSLEPNRWMATPLEGMRFDLRSRAYVFFTGDAVRYHGAMATFRLDGMPPHAAAGDTVPFDLMGTEDGSGLAQPFTTDGLAAGCHTLQYNK